jgi:hypothetical protein
VKSGFKIAVNGQEQTLQSAPSSFAEIRRQWKTGDRVEIVFPMTLRTECMPDNPKRVAVFYGPVLLAADLGPENDPESASPFYVPVIVARSRTVGDWVQPLSREKMVFQTDGAGRPRDFELTPFYRLHDRRYTAYLDLFAPEEWAVREAKLIAERERLRQIEERTLDTLRIGEMQPERDHKLEGANTTAGDFNGRKWRHASDGGWFAFEMEVAGNQPVDLLCTYWGSDAGGAVV